MTAQNNGIAKTIIIIVLFIGLVLGIFIRSKLMMPELTMEQLKERGVYVFEQSRLIKPFSLIDQHAQAITKKNLKGKFSLVFYGFTFCPDICPTTLAMLNNTMKLLTEQAEGDDELQAIIQDTQVIMISVDPARDTADILKSYVEYFNSDFIGVTGDFFQILSLASNMNAAFQKVPMGANQYTVDHSANIFLLNKHGDYQGFFKPPFSAEKLAFDYRAARKLLSQ